MKKDNKQNDLSEFSDYDKLVYFRWKALIRSWQYDSFCDRYDIKKLIENDDDEKGILHEAEREFGILADGLSDLEPIDKPLEELSMTITFKDYLHVSSKGEYYDYRAIKRIENLDDEFIKTYLRIGYKVFCINSKMPPLFILNSLLRELNNTN
jgi:hypothetical protein